MLGSAAEEERLYAAASPEYERLFRSYLELCAALGHRPDTQLAPASILSRISASGAPAGYGRPLGVGPASVPGLPMIGGGGSGGGGAALPALLGPQEAPTGGGGGGGRGGGRGRGKRRSSDDDGAFGGGGRGGGRGSAPAGGAPGVPSGPSNVAGKGAIVVAADGSPVPQEMAVVCNGAPGLLLLQELKVVCECGACARGAPETRVFSMTQWEIHCGLPNAKKWKASVRVAAGDSGSLAIGRWFEEKGIETKFAKGASGVGR